MMPRLPDAGIVVRHYQRISVRRFRDDTPLMRDRER